MNEVYRQEKKFILLLDEYYKFRNLFSQIVTADPHNEKEGYNVRSLYFDSLYDRDYEEKMDGEELRRKIRIRIYNPNDQFALLEMKQKQGIYQKKRSLRITRKDAILLSKGIYTPLIDYEEEFAMECYGMMQMYAYRPKSLIEYNREAYIIPANNTRITFDRNIRANESCYDLFSDQMNFYPVYDPFYIVLEVKYLDYLLSYVKDMIAACDKIENSTSKYILGRMSHEMIF